MKQILCLIIILYICTGCSFIKESPDSDTGNTAAETSEETSAILNSIVISKNDTGFMVAAYDNSGMVSFEPFSVHYAEAPSLEVTMGTLIKITYGGNIAESYPGQLWADKVEILESVKDNWPPTAKLPSDYTSEQAVKDNCFVIGLNKTEGEEVLNSFIQNTYNGIAGYLRRVNYTVEGNPIITDVIYDGNKYFIFEDKTRDAFGGDGDKLYKKEYKFINTYVKENKKIVYLADRNDITNEEFDQKIASSSTEVLPDIYLLSY
jgi:hypothetical protein